MYKTLQSNCCPNTIAMTSNEKYRSPLSMTYCNCCTAMYLYPSPEYLCDCKLTKEQKANAIKTLPSFSINRNTTTCVNCGINLTSRITPET
jgi:hypothetical protein